VLVILWSLGGGARGVEVCCSVLRYNRLASPRLAISISPPPCAHIRTKELLSAFDPARR
jgi:hypothetical protein